MNIPTDLKYTEDHEWLKVEGEIGIVGVTDFAQGELGDIVYVEVDTLGETLAKDEVFGTIEAVKTTSDLLLPVSGEILEFNPLLDENEGDDPELINKDPFGKGWIIKIKISDPSEIDELMDAESYKNHIS
ncbi:MAG: glycine cleavage system protein GcvH [Saprospiraceae bacterium]